MSRWLWGYGVWTALVLLVSFAHAGLNRDTVTRLLILAYLGLTLLAWRRRPPMHRPALVFVSVSAASSLAVEFFYMFSRPVFPSLLFAPTDPAQELLRKTLVDWAFTLPAYLVIYSVMWRLLQRYRYTLTEFVVLFSAGQALGDGNAFFMANPAMLLFIPYVMLNYQAITVLPFLWVRPHLTGQRRRGRWLAPLVVIPLTYLVMGASIQLVGRALGMA